MIVKIEIKSDPDSDHESEEDKYSRFLKKIYTEFPKAIWEKTKRGCYEVFI